LPTTVYADFKNANLPKGQNAPEKKLNLKPKKNGTLQNLKTFFNFYLLGESFCHLDMFAFLKSA
jgi:hypothetical protein